MGFGNFIKEVIEEEKNKTPEQRESEKNEKEKKKLDKVYEQYKDYIVEGEEVIYHTSNSKGTYLFLDKRILFHDDRLRKGTKTEYHSIPYKNIRRYTLEKAGITDLDTDIKLYLGGNQEASITLKVPTDSAKAINKIIVRNII